MVFFDGAPDAFTTLPEAAGAPAEVATGAMFFAIKTSLK
jgi:hypothetical protein